MDIGILGGSFNPIHIGHCILANYICQQLHLDEVWISVSPQNPLKQAYSQDYDEHRLKMAELAVEGHDRLKVCDIEFTMPRPSFTIHTLEKLSQIYPEHRFRIIIGSDNWQCFDKWKQSDDIIGKYGVIVYPRPACPLPKHAPHKHVTFIDAPQIDISSTFIRESLKAGLSMDFFMPEKVLDYIDNHKLYK